MLKLSSPTNQSAHYLLKEQEVNLTGNRSHRTADVSLADLELMRLCKALPTSKHSLEIICGASGEMAPL